MSEETQKSVNKKGEEEKGVGIKRKEVFTCGDCGLREEYDYYGLSAPFCRSVRFLQPSYVCRDPFSSSVGGNSANFLLLGSKCGACDKTTCQQCSVFYTQRLCPSCAQSLSTHLPQQVMKKPSA